MATLRRRLLFLLLFALLLLLLELRKILLADRSVILDLLSRTRDNVAGVWLRLREVALSSRRCWAGHRRLAV